MYETNLLMLGTSHSCVLETLKDLEGVVFSMESLLERFRRKRKLTLRGRIKWAALDRNEAQSLRERFAEFKDRLLGLLSILNFRANDVMIHHHERTLMLLEDIKEKQQEEARKRVDEARNNKKHLMKLKRDVEKLKISKDVQSSAFSPKHRNEESERGRRSQQQQKCGSTASSAITGGAPRTHTFLIPNTTRNNIQLISPDLPSTVSGMDHPFYWPQPNKRQVDPISPFTAQVMHPTIATAIGMDRVYGEVDRGVDSNTT